MYVLAHRKAVGVVFLASSLLAPAVVGMDKAVPTKALAQALATASEVIKVKPGCPGQRLTMHFGVASGHGSAQQYGASGSVRHAGQSDAALPAVNNRRSAWPAICGDAEPLISRNCSLRPKPPIDMLDNA
jgi:hypothetical protein